MVPEQSCKVYEQSFMNVYYFFKQLEKSVLLNLLQGYDSQGTSLTTRTQYDFTVSVQTVYGKYIFPAEITFP